MVPHPTPLPCRTTQDPSRSQAHRRFPRRASVNFGDRAPRRLRRSESKSTLKPRLDSHRLHGLVESTLDYSTLKARSRVLAGIDSDSPIPTKASRSSRSQFSKYLVRMVACGNAEESIRLVGRSQPAQGFTIVRERASLTSRFHSSILLV